MHPLAIALLALLALLLVAAAAFDLRSRVIPNRLNLGIALMAVPWWFAAGLTGMDVLIQIGVTLAVFLLFAACFAAGMMGGGDVKLIAALALWLPFGPLMTMLVWMALGGGVLTLAMVGARWIRKHPERLEIPYGVAIAGAALLSVANLILTTRTA